MSTARPEPGVEPWMGSTGNCGNIMSPNHRTTGVGHASGGRHAQLWTQKFGH